MHVRGWTARGLEFLEAMDKVPLLNIQTTLRGLGLEEHLGAAIRWKLTEILGQPVLAAPVLKKPRKMEKPAAILQRTWDEVVALQKADRRRAEKKRQAARMAA